MSTSRKDPLRAARKNEHIEYALQQRGIFGESRVETDFPVAASAGGAPVTDTGFSEMRNDFDDIEFMHHALSAVSVEKVDIGVRVGEWRWPVPFYINGMTGGTERADRINAVLAEAARETGVPLATGSCSIALDDASCRPGFRAVRKLNPDGFVLANLGADRPAGDALKAVELLQADALQLHLNAVQESVMPEGTRDFSAWQDSLAALVEASPVPVIVKEVGNGLSVKTLRQLAALNVELADVAGVGGTSFARIENARRPLGEYGFMDGFGQSAAACLVDASREEGAMQLLASGGVRGPLDVVRCLALGARAAGAAGVFLAAAAGGDVARVVRLVESWREGVRMLFALLGAEGAAGLLRSEILVRGRLREFALLRGVDVCAFGRSRVNGFTGFNVSGEG